MNENDINQSTNTTVIPKLGEEQGGTTIRTTQSVDCTTTTVVSNSNVIRCPKCGEEMKKTARYCMKCGNLNYAHPDNESMKQYAWQNIKQGYFIAGANIDKDEPLTMTGVSNNSLSKSNPYLACLITNSILLGLLALVFLLPALLTGGGIGYVFGVLIFVGILFIFSYSSQRILIKGGQPWWSAFIPVYNMYTSYAVAVGNGWMFLVTFIPIVGFFYALYALYSLGVRFGKNGWLTLFFSFVMIPIIGLEKDGEASIYSEKDRLPDNKLASNGKTASENRYGRKKFFITIIILIIIGVLVYIFWPVILSLFRLFLEHMEFYK